MKFTNEKINLIDELVTIGSQAGIAHLSAQAVSGRHITIEGRKLLNFCSLSYLGLDRDTRIRDGIIDAVTNHGSVMAMSSTFCSSPQFSTLHALMTELFGAYPIITPTTTLGHLSTLPVMVQEGDVLLLDSQVHNSVSLAAKTVADRARLSIVPHSNMGALEKKVQRVRASGGVNNIWYLADGIYSMFGDKAPLAEIRDLLERYDNFYAYIDDAHGMSVEGLHGRGYVLGSPFLHRKMIVSVSLSKAFGVGGGGAVVFQDKEWFRKVDNCGPVKIFSNQLQVPTVGAAVASAKIHLSPEIVDIQELYRSRVQLFDRLAKEAELPIVSVDEAPMKYVIAGGADRQALLRTVIGLRDDGFLVSPVTFPAVSVNHSGCRFSMNNHLLFEDIERLVESIARHVPRKIKSLNGRQESELL